MRRWIFRSALPIPFPTDGLSTLVVLAGAVLLLLTGCRRVDDAVVERFRDGTPHEEYLASLRRAGLGETALAQEWAGAAGAALRQPLEVEAPYREEGFLPPEDPEALGFRFQARDGQRISVELELAADTIGRLFVDLFRTRADGGWPPVPLESVDPREARTLEHEVRYDATYVLRIQPELLRGGRYRVTIRVGPSLAFPVEGRSMEAILSAFGAARDGGRREHHGVDIFAPLGTPALAATEGTVRRVRETPVGGKVVWIRDDRRRRSLYYAHLDSQLVRRGQRVSPGDTVGLVGNTGNARTTPPHLHFGIYSRGPTDPHWSLYTPPGELAPLEAPAQLLGGWARADRDGTRLRARPSTGAEILQELPLHTVLAVVARTGAWYRIRLPDGSGGFVVADLARDVEEEVDEEITSEPVDLLRGPHPGALRMKTVGNGTRLGVLGRFGEFVLVRTERGGQGWARSGRVSRAD